jgi:hypothetical protein
MCKHEEMGKLWKAEIPGIAAIACFQAPLHPTVRVACAGSNECGRGAMVGLTAEERWIAKGTSAVRVSRTTRNAERVVGASRAQSREWHLSTGLGTWRYRITPVSINAFFFPRLT